MKGCVHNWWEKYVILNIVSVENISSVIQFSHSDFSSML